MQYAPLTSFLCHRLSCPRCWRTCCCRRGLCCACCARFGRCSCGRGTTSPACGGTQPPCRLPRQRQPPTWRQCLPREHCRWREKGGCAWLRAAVSVGVSVERCQRQHSLTSCQRHEHLTLLLPEIRCVYVPARRHVCLLWDGQVRWRSSRWSSCIINQLHPHSDCDTHFEGTQF